MDYKRLFELLIAPILAGVVLHLLNAYAIPLLTKSEKSLSVIMPEVTTADITNPLVKILELNGELKQADGAIYVYQFQIRNNGDIPLDDVKLSYLFDDDVKILGQNRTANPHIMFWDIIDEKLSFNSRQITYKRINPGEVVTEFFLLNHKSNVYDIFSRSLDFALEKSYLEVKDSIPLLGFLQDFEQPNLIFILLIIVIFISGLIVTRLLASFLPIEFTWHLHFNDTNNLPAKFGESIKESILSIYGGEYGIEEIEERRIPIFRDQRGLFFTIKIYKQLRNKHFQIKVVDEDGRLWMSDMNSISNSTIMMYRASYGP